MPENCPAGDSPPPRGSTPWNDIPDDLPPPGDILRRFAPPPPIAARLQYCSRLISTQKDKSRLPLAWQRHRLQSGGNWGEYPGIQQRRGKICWVCCSRGVEPTGANLRAPIVPRSPLNPDGDWFKADAKCKRNTKRNNLRPICDCIIRCGHRPYDL